MVDGGQISLTYTKNLLLSGITYTVEWSTNLLDWMPAADVLVSSANLAEVRKASVPIGANTRIFMRLRIDQ